MTCDACAPYLSELAPGEALSCSSCGATLAALPDDPARPRAFHPGSPAGDLTLLARWLPDLSPRALEPCPVTCGPGHSGPSPGALAGRPDRIDARSRSIARAVAVWRRLRRLVGAGQGADVAVLWTAHALLVDRPEEAAARAGRQAAAVALGGAPRPLREEWATVARETRHEVRLPPPPPRVLVAGPAAAPLVRVCCLEVGTQAATWGAERLAHLWSPGPVPGALARAAALGFAPASLREVWGHLRSPALRDAAVRAWGEARLAEAEEIYRSAEG